MSLKLSSQRPAPVPPSSYRAQTGATAIDQLKVRETADFRPLIVNLTQRSALQEKLKVEKEKFQQARLDVDAQLQTLRTQVQVGAHWHRISPDF